MALPKNKYSDPKHTPGKEFTINGKPYIGWYITTYRGENYTGKYYDNDSRLLTPVENSTENMSPVFIEQKVEPSPSEKKEGVWQRYFIQKLGSLKIIEVSRLRYTEFNKVGGYRRGILDWKIKGPAENQNINGYTYFGASHINQVNTQALEASIPGISNLIKDYSEFVD